MPKVSKGRWSSRPRKRSSRSRNEPDTLTRLHAVRRKLEAERKRLGMSFKEYFEYIEKENRKLLAEFKIKPRIYR